MKKPLLLILAFILIIQTGAFLTEKVKQLVAHQRGYESLYKPGWGRSFYDSDEMDIEFDHARKLYNNDRSRFKNSPEWKLVLKRNEKDHAMIELSGLLFVLIVSAVGWGLFFYRRKNGNAMDWLSWGAVLLSLFFMREVVMSAFNWCRGGILCDEAALWTYFNLHPFAPVRFVTIIGISLLLFILYTIPKESRLLFLACGFIGSVAGFFIWLMFVSRILRI